jgi:hypothetical protein
MNAPKLGRGHDLYDLPPRVENRHGRDDLVVRRELNSLRGTLSHALVTPGRGRWLPDGGGQLLRIRGRAKWKVAPRSALAVAQNLPPCASMIERLIESPMPMPPGFVVKKALKS